MTGNNKQQSHHRYTKKPRTRQGSSTITTCISAQAGGFSFVLYVFFLYPFAYFSVLLSNKKGGGGRLKGWANMGYLVLLSTAVELFFERWGVREGQDGQRRGARCFSLSALHGVFF